MRIWCFTIVPHRFAPGGLLPILVGCALLCAPSLLGAPLLWALERPEAKEAGPSHLLVHRKASAGIEVLASPATAHAGELLQLSYIPAGRLFGVIISIDGRGHVTLHLPISRSGSSRLASSQRAFLPRAFELDDAPEFERFIFVTANVPIDVETVLQAGYALGRDPAGARTLPLPLPAFCSQNSFLVRKQGTPAPFVPMEDRP